MTKPEIYIGERSGAMRVWLLGGFRVSVGARTVEDGGWRLRKSASLVKLLALAPGHKLQKELTNRQISTEISISERTAANHVAKILRKLGLRSRAQIAAHAGSIVDAADGRSGTAPGIVASDE